MQLCRWAKWSGSAQREARDVCVERRAEIRRWPWHSKTVGEGGCRSQAGATLWSGTGGLAWRQLKCARQGGSNPGKDTLPAEGAGDGSRQPLAFHRGLRAVQCGDLSSARSQPDPEHETCTEASQSRPAHYFTPSLTLLFPKPQGFQIEQVLKKPPAKTRRPLLSTRGARPGTGQCHSHQPQEETGCQYYSFSGQNHTSAV